MDSGSNNNDGLNDPKNESNASEIKFEEYYENNENEEKLMMTDGKNIANFKEIVDENEIKNIMGKNNETEKIVNDIENNDNDSLEREEMENEYELMKSLNDLKEKNKKLKSLNDYQKTKIDSLESFLEKANNKIQLMELELNEYKSNDNNNTGAIKNTSSNTGYINQIHNLNTQLDKYKNLINDKKSEYNLLLEKYNDIQKKYNQLFVNDKKRNQELINKDKQIVKLLDDLDKKNISVVSNTAQQMKDKENEKLIQENKKLEKQKNDLYAAFKKSLKLCSILKKQKVHLENARLLAFTEDEFKNLIEENKI